jgi:hypothetical protein
VPNDVSPSRNKLQKDFMFHNQNFPSWQAIILYLDEGFHLSISLPPLFTIFASHELNNEYGHKVMVIGYL